MKKLSLKEKIDISNIVHNFKYNYDQILNVPVSKHVIINCPIHGDFSQKMRNHIYIKQGCPKCGGTYKLDIDSFKIKANNIHKFKYGYNYVFFKNNKNKIKIECGDHFFIQRVDDHLNGHGCPICANVYHKNNEEYIKDCSKIHNNKYIYDKTVYKNNKSKVIITCLKHGDFVQESLSHLRGHGCPKCNNSKGEILIDIFLKNKNIKYEVQKTFEDLKRIQNLYFDFYLTEHNVCIEYDGIQHFKPIKKFGGINRFLIVKEIDKIKNDWCFKNNIQLIRFSYKNNENYIYKILEKYI